MNNDFKTTWETYKSSWKADEVQTKREIFEKCLDASCVYNDPLEIYGSEYIFWIPRSYTPAREREHCWENNQFFVIQLRHTAVSKIER